MLKNVFFLKFKGVLVGVVLGDCIGLEFEGLWVKSIGVEKVLKSIGKLELEYDFVIGIIYIYMQYIYMCIINKCQIYWYIGKVIVYIFIELFMIIYCFFFC